MLGLLARLIQSVLFPVFLLKRLLDPEVHHGFGDYLLFVQEPPSVAQGLQKIRLLGGAHPLVVGSEQVVYVLTEFDIIHNLYK